MAIPFDNNPLGVSVKKGGSGTATDPYLIWTAEEFRVFRNEITAGKTFSGIYHKLMADIDLTGISFTASNATEIYGGNFNGNFKIISNYSCSNFGTYSGGLFRRTDGYIYNLGVENVYIDNRGGAVNNGNGGISGNNYGTIERCYVTGTILPSNARTGGIVGYCGPTSVVRDCWTNTVITGAGARYAGIAGSVYGTIENCYALGNVVSTANTYVGGIAGDNAGSYTLRNCVAAMNSITSSNLAYRIIGNGAVSNLANNYALDTMLVKNAQVTGTAVNANGANATLAQLKSLAFYRDTMGWDMDNVWIIDDGYGYPKLRGFPFTAIKTDIQVTFTIPEDNYTINQVITLRTRNLNDIVIIDWGDGVIENVAVGTTNYFHYVSKTYARQGVYQVRIYEPDSGANLKLINFTHGNVITSVQKFNGEGINDIYQSFYAQTSLVKFAPSEMRLPNVTSFSFMFFFCTNLETPPINLAGFSKLAATAYMYHGCAKLSGMALPVINTAPPSLLTHEQMFTGCTGLSDYSQIPAGWK